MALAIDWPSMSPSRSASSNVFAGSRAAGFGCRRAGMVDHGAILGRARAPASTAAAMAGKSPLTSVESSCSTVGCIEQTIIAATNARSRASRTDEHGHLRVRRPGRIVAVACRRTNRRRRPGRVSPAGQCDAPAPPPARCRLPSCSTYCGSALGTAGSASLLSISAVIGPECVCVAVIIMLAAGTPVCCLDALADAAGRLAADENHVVGDQQQRGRAVGKKQRGTEQRIVHARAIARGRADSRRGIASCSGVMSAVAAPAIRDWAMRAFPWAFSQRRGADSGRLNVQNEHILP